MSSPWLPLVGLRKYLPLKIAGAPPLENFVGGLQEGELQMKKLAINGTLDELRNVAQSAAKGLVSFDVELRNVGLKPNTDGYLPVQGLQGKIRLEKGKFTFTDLKASYGQSRLTGGDGTYQLAPGAKEISTSARRAKWIWRNCVSK